MSFNLGVFEKALRSHDGTILSSQVAYRYVNSALLTKGIVKNPLNSLYSYGRGYRFNFPYTFPALYLALSDFVATLEAGQNPDPLATVFDNREKEPAIIYSIKVSGRFANLVGRKSLAELTLDPHQPEYLIPTLEWETMASRGNRAVTHEIGQAVYDAGFDGIIYFSFPAWELRYRYNVDILSNMCVFMSLEDPNIPKNNSCRLEIFEQNGFTERLIK